MNRFAMEQGKPFDIPKEVPEYQPEFVMFNIPGNTCKIPIMIPSNLKFSNEDYTMFNRMNRFIDEYFNMQGCSSVPFTAYLTGYNDCMNFRVEIKSPEGHNLPHFLFEMRGKFIIVDNKMER